jgi:hypothetical protein
MEQDELSVVASLLTVCVTRWWAGVDSAGEQEKARSQKNARKCGTPRSGSPTSRLHALLARFLLDHG